MVHRNKPQLVDVVDLFHRLHEAHAQPAVHRLNLRAIHLYPLAGVGNIAPLRREPMPHHPRAYNIRH